METQKKRNTVAVFGREFYDADATFHKTLFCRTDNMILKSIIDAVWVCDKYHKERIRCSYIETTVQKHRTIIAALESHDFEQYSNAMHYHFDVLYKVSKEDLHDS